MNKEDFTATLRRSPLWNEDRYGNFKTESGKTRAKIQQTSVRFERKLSNGIWFNSASDYYKNITMEHDNNGNPCMKIKNTRVRLYRF
jgi:hypothetical protein